MRRPPTQTVANPSTAGILTFEAWHVSGPQGSSSFAADQVWLVPSLSLLARLLPSARVPEEATIRTREKDGFLYASARREHRPRAFQIGLVNLLGQLSLASASAFGSINVMATPCFFELQVLVDVGGSNSANFGSYFVVTCALSSRRHVTFQDTPLRPAWICDSTEITFRQSCRA